MPAFLRRLRARIKYWNNPEQVRREIETHRAMAESALREDGASAREARWRAARLLGNDTIAREDARAVWIVQWLEHAMQDLRYASRTLRREWAFTLGASVTLALGIGVLAGVFTVFNAIFLRPWPVRDPGKVFGISATAANPAPNERSGRRVSYAVWDQMRGGISSATLAVRLNRSDRLRIEPADRGRNARFALVDDDFLQTIGIGFQRGSLSSPEGARGAAITDRVWRDFLNSDPDVIGRTIRLGDTPILITGVLEPRFRGFAPDEYDGVMLLNQAGAWKNDDGQTVRDFLTNPARCCVEVFGRLKPGYTRAAAAQEIEARINAAHTSLGLPALRVVAWDTAMASRPGGVKNSLPRLFALLFTGCGIITLLACANIGNLQLARGMRRTREVSMRLSLGATRGRVVRQFLTESAALAAVGAAGGLLIAWTVPAAILSMEPGSSQFGTPDGTVVAFAILVGVLTTLSFGLAPALRVTRIDWRRAAAGITPGAGRLRGVLLGLQIALSLALVASASLLSRGALRAAGGADAGFEFRDVHVFSTLVGSDRFEATKAARQELARTVRADPRWALADDAPWRGHMPTSKVSIEGSTESVTVQPLAFNSKAVALLRLPLRSGRWPSDDARLKEAVVSQSLAHAIWNTTDVLGRKFSATGNAFADSELTVVGTMGEVRMQDTTARPAFVTALLDDDTPVILGSASLESEVRALFARAHPDIRLLSRSLIDGLRETMEDVFLAISIASGLGFVALLLASFGVFGVFAYLIEERRREIGVRLALGASTSQIRRSVFGMTRGPVVGGLIVGLALAIAAGFVLRRNLFGLPMLDPVSYLAVAGILGFAALVATYVPLRRALRVDPALTLRND